FPTRINHFFLV
ncbi:hypothetical protein N499_0486B, partial [Wolbachia pipientis wVitA]